MQSWRKNGIAGCVLAACFLVFLLGTETRMLMNLSSSSSLFLHQFHHHQSMMARFPEEEDLRPTTQTTIVWQNNTQTKALANTNNQTFQHHSWTTTSVKIVSPEDEGGSASQNLGSVVDVPSSPVCRPTWGRHNDASRIGRVYFAHTRKAGGTFLKNLLQRACQKYDWEFASGEGTPVESRQRDDTLYVTNLRHPVDRIRSQYQYEGRWNCRQLVFNQTGFEPTSANARTFHEFVHNGETWFPANTPECYHNDKNGIVQQQQNRRRVVPKLWVCTKLCYLRWYGANFNCLRNLSHSFETAMERLSHQFHLVVITEWLNIPEYRAGLLRMFGMSSRQRIDKRMFCDVKSKYWNRRYPAILTNETLQHLHRINQWDIKLYETLTNNCPSQQDVIFPAVPEIRTPDSYEW